MIGSNFRLTPNQWQARPLNNDDFFNDTNIISLKCVTFHMISVWSWNNQGKIIWFWYSIWNVQCGYFIQLYTYMISLRSYCVINRHATSSHCHYHIDRTSHRHCTYSVISNSLDYLLDLLWIYEVVRVQMLLSSLIIERMYFNSSFCHDQIGNIGLQFLWLSYFSVVVSLGWLYHHILLVVPYRSQESCLFCSRYCHPVFDDANCWLHCGLKVKLYPFVCMLHHFIITLCIFVWKHWTHKMLQFCRVCV